MNVEALLIATGKTCNACPGSGLGPPTMSKRASRGTFYAPITAPVSVLVAFDRLIIAPLRSAAMARRRL